MKRLLPLLFLFGGPIYAVPVVPNFSAGSVTSRTESSQNTREIIKLKKKLLFLLLILPQTPVFAVPVVPNSARVQ